MKKINIGFMIAILGISLIFVGQNVFSNTFAQSTCAINSTATPNNSTNKQNLLENSDAVMFSTQTYNGAVYENYWFKYNKDAWIAKGILPAEIQNFENLAKNFLIVQKINMEQSYAKSCGTNLVGDELVSAKNGLKITCGNDQEKMAIWLSLEFSNQQNLAYFYSNCTSPSVSKQILSTLFVHNVTETGLSKFAMQIPDEDSTILLGNKLLNIIENLKKNAFGNVKTALLETPVLSYNIFSNSNRLHSAKVAETDNYSLLQIQGGIWVHQWTFNPAQISTTYIKLYKHVARAESWYMFSILFTGIVVCLIALFAKPTFKKIECNTKEVNNEK
ncbi:MAG: hypothetical protein RR140_02070 [Clostridia bacterium]